MGKLLFIDTNIYLDFYRVRNEVGMALMNHLSSIKDKVIVTYQVDMEFKKHRQQAILETIKELKAPSQIPRPGILSEDRSYAALQKDISQAVGRVKKLKDRLQRVLEDPKRNDPVYKSVQKILSKNDELNLTRDMKLKHTIRRQAFRRFLYGYPPRKKSDTSIGDAVNWEWLIEVSKKTGEGIVIVSRDSDYGITIDGQSYINDWLREEFHDRTSRRRELRLTSRLSDALKEFAVPVTEEEREGEEAFIKKSIPQEWTHVDIFRWINEMERGVRELHSSIGEQDNPQPTTATDTARDSSVE